MNFSDNLKRLRKENNLSQEELAEKLKVSRQSVSKWESNTAYPEMDKIIQLSNMFNVGIDELLNKDIREVQEEKQNKINVNKYIDDFLSFITKSVDMFLNMKFKDKIKFIFEELFVAFILWIIFLLIGGLLGNLFNTAFGFIHHDVIYFFRNILGCIYSFLALCCGTIILLHIYKTRYLDYYVIVDKEELEKESTSEEKTSENNINEKVKEKINFSDKREKIIIRDPDHSGYKFINGLLKVLLILIKINVAFVFVGFCFSFIGFVITLVLSFAISKTGLFFLGILLSILSCILVNYIILNILFNFIISHKSKWKLLFIMFIASLVLLGSGIGIGAIGFSKFNFVKAESHEVEETIPMTENSFILNHYSGNYEYVESDNSDLRLVISCPNSYECSVEQADEIININTYVKDYDAWKSFHNALDRINKMKLVTDDSIDVKIYTNKENIDKLQNNFELYVRGE